MVFLQTKEIYPPLSFTSGVDSGTAINTWITSNLPCKVCDGEGLVYGKDGKPYLCPKCDGDKVDKNKQTYPIYPYYPWTSPFYYGDFPNQDPVIMC